MSRFKSNSLCFVLKHDGMSCLSSIATLLLISDGAMPNRQYTLFIVVSRRHPVTAQQVLLSVVFTCLTCFNLLHTGKANSAAEKHNSNTIVRIVCARSLL